jgi:hypothetical protein
VQGNRDFAEAPIVIAGDKQNVEALAEHFNLVWTCEAQLVPSQSPEKIARRRADFAHKKHKDGLY